MLYGKHKGFISGKDWIKVQEILEKQENMRYRMKRKSKSILSGILICAKCGNYLRPKASTNVNGERFYYKCELKEKSNRQRCNIKNLNGNDTDKIVLEKVKELIVPNSTIYKVLKNIVKVIDEEENEKNEKISRLNSLYRKNKRDKENYLEKISRIDDNEVLQDIVEKIRELNNSNKEIEKEMRELDISKNQMCSKETAQYVLDIIDNHFNSFDKLEVIQQRELIKLLVKNVITDGETLTINMLGSIANTSELQMKF